VARNAPVSAARGIYALRILEAHGYRTVNRYVTQPPAGQADDHRALAEARWPQPRINVAFTPNRRLAAIEQFGYPVVLKPVVGSWGRLLSKINDRDAAETILEHKDVLGSTAQHLLHQEYVKNRSRHPRFVIAIRPSAHLSRLWALDHTRRARASEQLRGDAGVERPLPAAARAVGGGVLAIDVLEDPDRASW